jgi:predicted aspartyl protease
MTKFVRQRLLLLISILLCLNSIPASANDFAEGVKFYSAEEYAQARDKFQKAIDASDREMDAYYYLALANHMMGDFSQAKQYYKLVVERFPASRVAKYAHEALSVFPNLVYEPKVSELGLDKLQGEVKPDAPDLSVIPEHEEIPFEIWRQVPIVAATINNRPTYMIFDTGAGLCNIGKNHLRDMGLPEPKGVTVGKQLGAGGSKKTVPYQIMLADLQVGKILRKNVRIAVHENMSGVPILGQNFIGNFEYTVDNRAGSITFKKESSEAALADERAVPFEKKRQEVIVTATLNNVPCEMIFDTGAFMTMMSVKQFSDLGFEIPNYIEPTRAIGIAGVTRIWKVPIATFRLGPIVKQNMEIAVAEDFAIPYPLLGQNVFGEMVYTVDNQHKLIRFWR